MLAEFADTNLNAEYAGGRKALHWTCPKRLVDMTESCLSLLSLGSSIACLKRPTAFDIAYEKWRESDSHAALPALFYKSAFKMEKHDRQGALLLLITLTESG